MKVELTEQQIIIVDSIRMLKERRRAVTLKRIRVIQKLNKKTRQLRAIEGKIAHLAELLKTEVKE